MYETSDKVKQQIINLPHKPGVYFFYDQGRHVIYIGKAADLKERINSHFRNPLSARDFNKVKNTEKITSIECQSEIEALFLEPEFIKRYQPKYNVEWKDNKNFLYVEIKKDNIPEIKLVRKPYKKPSMVFYGPYVDSKAIRRALRLLTRIFPIKYSERGAFRPGIRWHQEIIEKMFPKANFYRRIKLFFQGKVGKLIKEFQDEMNQSVKHQQFEKAALFRDRIKALVHVKETAIFRKEESESIKADQGLIELKKVLKLKNFPNLIEAYDISNIFGSEAVGSIVYFKGGVSDKSNYKRFRIRLVKGINDYGMMKEVLDRRFNNKKNIPDLVLIDGGKGHLGVVLKTVRNISDKIDVVSIAKREEELFIHDDGKGIFEKVILAKNNSALLLIQRIRDEAHRFAITYHRLLRAKKTRHSVLDDIGGVGRITKNKLIKEFKTIENIKKAPLNELRSIVGQKIAIKIKESLGKIK
ncbi:hypothetical protein COY76_03980 [bacterium CG_4_10_14_0_8_um_filter_33_57]|nr:MAG: hypothetical protein COY76_03980 [bacterium CG_4_10_14_0_8_um_filter_33_57]